MKENKREKTQIAVIGAGASGMIAAITAKRQDKDINVTVFEAKEENGRKINATGNGKCNLSNTNMGIEYYRGENYKFADFALKSFNVSDTIVFFESIGIKIKDRNGYLYPHSEEASQVSMALSITMNSLNVKTIHEEVTDITRSGDMFKIVTNTGEYTADKVIIACGSFANTKKWNEFKGYELVKKLGHKVTKLYPSLCQLRCSDKFFKTIHGVRTIAKIDIFANGRRVASDTGELLFTDYGISGIPAFQVSSCSAKYLDRKEKVTASIDLAPDIDEADLLMDLKNRKDYNGRTAEEGMFGLLNHKLNYVLLNKTQINPLGDIKKEFTDSKILKLANEMKNFNCEIIGTNDYSFAQVISGGADTNEIDPKTMESVKVPGLYFAGEIIDIDGICGGYNLQWAWSSGYLAGISAVGEK